MISYVICTAIALVLGIVMSTIILGIMMSTKIYAKMTAKIVKNVLLSKDYRNICEEMAKSSIEIATETVKAETISNGDEA